MKTSEWLNLSVAITSEYDIYIFGMLFLKRLSDEFDEAYQRKIRQFTVLHEKPLSYEDAELRAKGPSRYKEFFVPETSRWSYIWQNLNNPGVGELLNTLPNINILPTSIT